MLLIFFYNHNFINPNSWATTIADYFYCPPEFRNQNFNQFQVEIFNNQSLGNKMLTTVLEKYISSKILSIILTKILSRSLTIILTRILSRIFTQTLTRILYSSFYSIKPNLFDQIQNFFIIIILLILTPGLPQ